MTTFESETSAFWLLPYRDGFIEFTRNDDDPKCFEIQGIFTALEAIEVHTFISRDYKYLCRHAQSLFDWLVDSLQQRVIHPQQGMGGANRFYLNNDLFTSFTAIRPDAQYLGIRMLMIFQNLYYLFLLQQQKRGLLGGWNLNYCPNLATLIW